MRSLRGLSLVCVAALCSLAACGSGKGTSSATSAPTTTTTAAPTVQYRPTKLSVSGFSPGVNQAPFYPTIEITAVTCSAGTVTAAIPAGGPGTPAKSALTVPTSLVFRTGRAELRDRAGKVLYNEVDRTLSANTHGSVVISMTNVATTDTDARRVAVGAFDVSGDYLCP
jgi:hypothetical protein